MTYLESVDNALRLMLLLAREEELGVTEAAQQLGIAPSSAHRLFTTLKYREFVTQTDTRTYRKGPALHALSDPASRKVDLVAVARPAMERLRTALDETCHLMVRVEREVRFLASVEADQPLRVSSRAGAVLPAHLVSGGKVLLAELDDDELAKLYGAAGTRTDALDVAEVATLRRQLVAVRRRGYGVNKGETERGIAAVAVAVRDSDEVAVAAISVSLPTVRYSSARIPDLVRALRTAADAVTRATASAPRMSIRLSSGTKPGLGPL